MKPWCHRTIGPGSQGSSCRGGLPLLLIFKVIALYLPEKRALELVPRALSNWEERSLFRSRFALLLRSYRSQGQIVWVDCRTRKSILSARIGVSRVGPGFGGWQVPPGPSPHRIQYLQPATGRGAHSFWGNLQGTRERKKGTDGDGKTNVGPVSVP